MFPLVLFQVLSRKEVHPTLLAFAQPFLQIGQNGSVLALIGIDLLISDFLRGRNSPEICFAGGSSVVDLWVIGRLLDE